MFGGAGRPFGRGAHDTLAMLDRWLRIGSANTQFSFTCVLRPEVLDLVQSTDVAMHLAACDARLCPHLTRGLGARCSSDGLTLTAWMAASRGASLLRDIASSGRVALVVSHMETFQTVQLKGTDAAVIAIDEAGLAAVAAYRDGFIRKATSLGYYAPMVRKLVESEPPDLVGVRFTPSSVFIQTPGPGAGEAIGVRA